MRAEFVNVQRRMQCEQGLRTTNYGGRSIQMTLLETVIAVLHRLSNGRRVVRHAQCNVMTV